MRLGSTLNKSNSFKINFEEHLKTKIYESINNGEIKVILSKDYVNEVLCSDYELMYLFFKIKELLLDTDLNISVRKLNKQLVFYKKIDGINRESDFIKMNFEEKLKPRISKILKKKHSITFEERFLKEYLNVNYGADRIYIKLRDMLVDTEIAISVKKNIDVNNNKSNHFIFYKKRESKPQNQYERVNFVKEIDVDEEDFKNYIKESIEENKKIKEEIHKESLEGLSKSLSLDTDNYCECPICKKRIEYFSEKCEHCSEELKWI